MDTSAADEAAQGQRTVLARMRALLPDLRPSERRIASLFLAEPAAAAALSIAELASRCGTSTTSVVRFSKTLGYDQIKLLRMDVFREVTRESYSTTMLPAVSGDIAAGDSLSDVVAKVSLAETLSIADSAEMLDVTALGAAVDLVVGAHRIDIFGVGAGAIVALDLQQKLTRIGRTALSWTDTHAAWTAAATLHPGSVVVALSHSGATVDTVEFLSIARKSGATAIAITNHDRSPLAGLADVVLTTAARETGFRSGALGSRIAQLMIVDCLFIGVAQATHEESNEALRHTYAVVQRFRTTV